MQEFKTLSLSEIDDSPDFDMADIVSEIVEKALKKTKRQQSFKESPNRMRGSSLSRKFTMGNRQTKLKSGS